VLIDARRPLIMNGIADLAIRPDLLDRAIPLYLPRLSRWIPEDEFFERFRAARPRILGALLDAVSAAIANLPTVEFNGAVRMADFAKWTIAAEPALGIEPGGFMRAYAGNQAEAVEITLEASPLTEPLRTVAAEGFEGTATDLLTKLAGLVEEKVAGREGWPGSARALSADLGRLAPVLRRVGIEVERPPRRKGKRLIVIGTEAHSSVTSVICVTPEASTGAGGDGDDASDAKKQTRSSARAPLPDRPIVVIGDDLYPLLLADAAEQCHITAQEFDERYAFHKAIEALA
jgi:hypothetical protein